MEAQQQQQQQQPYHYHYQYQTLNDPLPPSYDSSSSSHLQSYDQSTQQQQQPYYASYHHYNQPQQPQQPQQDYSSYYYPQHDYSSSSYQTLNSDPNLIHPPGVPIQADNTQQSHLGNAHNLYYSHGVSVSATPPSQGYTLPSNTTYSSGGGSHTGLSVRGGGTGRGTFGRHGRGRGGGGRGKRGPPQTPGSSSGPVAPPPRAKPPPQKVWCELCKVECNTHEILEQHKNGKKHLKNVKVHDELQNLSQPKTTQNNAQIRVSHPKNLENAHTNNPENAEAKSEASLKIDESTPKTESSSGVAPPSEKPVRKERGFKRCIRGGRGGKFTKAYDGSRRQSVFEPPKPKQLGYPVVCELCNVKCESQVVYISHIVGKKHLANAKRVQAHNGDGGPQALCQTTAIPNHPSTSIITPPGPGPQDAQALASMMLSQQNLQDPQAAQAALTQLLSQHGIHDAQTLLVQLIPYMLTQFQVPVGSIAAAPLAGFGMVNSLNPQTQGMMASVPESKAEEQNVTNNDGIGGDEKNSQSVVEGECLDKRPVEELAKEELSVVEKEKQSS